MKIEKINLEGKKSSVEVKDSIFLSKIKLLRLSKFSKSRFIFSAISLVPALPGKQNILSVLFEFFKL